MWRLYLAGTILVVLALSAANVVHSLRAERDAAFEHGKLAGRDELQLKINAETERIRLAQDSLVRETDQKLTEMVNVQKHVEEQNRALQSLAIGASSGDCLDRDVVHALNRIGSDVDGIAKAP